MKKYFKSVWFVVLGCLLISLITAASYRSFMVNGNGDNYQFIRHLKQAQFAYSADTAALINSIAEYTIDNGVDIETVNLKDGLVDGRDVATDGGNIDLNTTHRASDGKNHADVVLNNTHRTSDGTDHSNVVLNDTHRASDGKNHADVVLNNTHRTSDGTDHSNVVLNDTHRASDGKNHADVVLNNTHRTSDGTDHSNVVLNDTHRASDGKNHADVVLNNTHRTGDGTDHANVVPKTGGSFTGDVGIGITSPDGTLHVHTASSGTVAPQSNASDLVIESNIEGGITILTPDSQSARLIFGSPSDNNGAEIFYRQNITKMNIGTQISGGILALLSGDGVTALTIDANQDGTWASDLHVTDIMTAGTKTFKIDHPLYPKDKFLFHSVVESPEMRNEYYGQVALVNGKATVTMPDWWHPLNGINKSEFNYQLTPIGGFCQLYVSKELENGTFEITGNEPNIKVSWKLSAIRHDDFAESHRVQVEVDKIEVAPVEVKETVKIGNETYEITYEEVQDPKAKGFYIHPNKTDRINKIKKVEKSRIKKVKILKSSLRSPSAKSKQSKPPPKQNQHK